MKRVWWSWGGAVLCLAMAVAQAAEVAGTVEFVSGAVRVEAADGRAAAVRRGDSLREGDTVVTGAAGELHAHMADHGYIAVRPDSRLRIEAYRARGDDGDRSLYALLAGTFRSITGFVGRNDPGRYAVRTPLATIGVRGTDHEPMVVLPGAAGGAEPGVYDKVNEGSTWLESGGHRVELGAGQAGFSPHGAQGAPRLLAAVPHFYRASRHERRIDAARERLARVLARHPRLQGRPGLRHPHAAGEHPGVHPERLHGGREHEGRREGEHEHPGRARPGGPRED